MNRMPKLWGGMLIAGALVVSGVVIWLFAYYVQEGIFSTTVGIVAAGVSLLVLVLPQVGFGIYILRFGGQINNSDTPDKTL